MAFPAFSLFATPALAEEGPSITLPGVTVSETRVPNPLAGSNLLEGAGLARQRAAVSDTASLLSKVPGMSLFGAGGVSSLPSLHGLADDRLRIQVDGMDLVSACANHMNPALSYIDPSQVDAIEVFGGITPVSAGGDSIGGAIQVRSAAPEFAQPGQGLLAKGQAGAYYRSNGNGRGANVALQLAGETASLRYTGSTAQSDNYEAAQAFKTGLVPGTTVRRPGAKEVGSTQFKSINQAVDLAWRLEDHLLELRLGSQNIPYQGFPNQRMDMTRNTSEQANLRYTGQFDWGKLQARAYSEHTRHTMNFLENKLGNVASLGMPMDTEGFNSGALLKADLNLSARDTLAVGAELQRYRMNDWWDPISATPGMMAPHVFWNIRDGQRDRADAFAEWDAAWSGQWQSQVGVRAGTVRMDAGRVQGYNTMAGMMGYGDPANPSSIPGAFNAADHQKTDTNVDASALLRYTPDAERSFVGGFSRKTRSPNLYERFAWSTNNNMVMNMINWVGDANGYVGNLALKPETAYTASATADWHDARRQQWGVQLTAHATYVQDYIDAVSCAAVGKTCPARTDGFVNLSFANQSARLHGVDVSGYRVLSGSPDADHLTLSGQISALKGRNADTDSGLYNTMPLNAKLALAYATGRWTHTAEAQFVDAKTDLSKVRNEQATAGYGLLNLRSSVEWKTVRLDLGIDNVLDRLYASPLGGAYVGESPKIWGIPVPGAGRSLYVSVSAKF